jgi:putative lipoic acid-binding regulatory protein
MATGDDNKARETALEFPCEFPIKMMGRDEPGFHDAAREIIAKHVDDVDHSAWRSAMSSKANFVSITVTITATSQAQLDGIYEDLSAHEAILVAL